MVAENSGMTFHIPISIDNGIQVETTSTEFFEQRFELMPKYPVERACQLYLNYCKAVGGSDEVLDYLNQEITLTKEDREMVATKNAARKAATTPKSKTPAKKKPVVKKTTTKAEAPAKAKAAPKKVAAKKQDGEYKSAAAMFMALIMAGKLTDDEIFASVQAEFGLDDKKRSYVSWYRNKLRKDGENPPDAKK